MNVPKDLLYTEDDEWVQLEDDEAVIGVTDYAQDSLSDIVYLELPDVGDAFEQGEAFGVVESVKAAADLYMPVSGRVLAINEPLLEEPEKINTDPYGEGWMVRIKMVNADELDDLMDDEAYRAYLEERD